MGRDHPRGLSPFRGTVKIRSLAELSTPDDRTLIFANGLRADAAAEFHQRTIADADLTSDVPEGTRNSFERLRTLHSYGVFCYEAFTVADDLTWLVLEQALGERFVTYFNGSIPLVPDKRGTEETITAQNYKQVYEALHGGVYSKGWSLKLQVTDELMRFRGTLPDLLAWARQEGLLHGQRNKRLELLYRNIRNSVAHQSYHAYGPVNSARSIRDLAEVINRLWGVLTPGGRLYPTPLEREVLVIAWSDELNGPILALLRGDQLPSFNEPGDWTYLVVLGLRDHNNNLEDFDAQFERTPFATDLLWGPGSKAAALAWLEAEQPAGDAVTYLDRLFAVQTHNGKVYLPRQPEVAMALPMGQQNGEWRIIRADYPNDAFSHVRHINGGLSCPSTGPLQTCSVEDIYVGDWQGMIEKLRSLSVDIAPSAISTVRVPRRRTVASDVGDT